MNTKQSVAQLAVPHRKRLSSTMVVALLLCVVAGAVMINAADFPATAIETDPGASAFPTFYACALIVLAVLLVIRDLLQAKPASCANAQEKPAFRKTATGIAATAFYIVAMRLTIANLNDLFIFAVAFLCIDRCYFFCCT